MNLPEGFALDSGSTSLPEGFTLDEASAASANPLVDVAKSFPAGAAKGVIGVAGMPGNLSTWLGGVVRKAVQYFNPGLTDEKLAARENEFWDQMNDPENMKTMAAFGAIPSPPLTSADIQRGVEKTTGPLPEPQITAGKYAQTIGEFLPAALATGPEGVVANAAKLGVAPAVASEAAGEKFEGSPYEGAARFVGGLLGGGAGIAAGKGVEAAQNFNAARGAAADIGSDVNPGAVSRMAKSYAADNLTPDIVAQRQAALGPQAMTLDMGRQMQGRAEAIASQPGEGQNTVLNAVQSRVHGTDPMTGLPNEQFGAATADRIKDTLDAQLGVSHNKVDLLNGVSDIVNRVSKPLYQSVMDAHPVVNVPDEITSRPAVAAAMKNATTLAKQYGEQLSSPQQVTKLNAGGVPVTQTEQLPAQPSLQYWDYVKKDLDRRVNAYMKSGGASELNSADKADLGGLIDARNALRNNLDQQTNGQYAQARRVWSFKPDLTDAYETGRSAFNSKLLPEEFSAQVNDMSAPEQVMAKAGYRRELENLIDVARNDGAKARSLLDTNSNQQKIEALFGSDARQAVENRIGAETRFQTAANNIAANSRTGVRTQLVKDTESPSIAAPPMANIGGLAYKGATSAADYLRGMNTEKTRAAIGRMATARGPQLTNLADVLARYNAQRAANAGTSLPQQISGLASVLAAAPNARLPVASPPVQ